MSNSKNDKSSRRKFLSLGFLGGASLLAGKADAKTPIESGEKVRMLTPDGQLVEVDKSVLEAMSKGHKATNESILDWTNQVKK